MTDRGGPRAALSTAGRADGSGARSPLFGAGRIRVTPDPVLRLRARRVSTFNSDLVRLVDDMFTVMHAAGGVGLAANQIGVDLAVFVMDCAGIRAAVVNPVLLDLPALLEPADVPTSGRHPGGDTDGQWETASEGCLSLPGLAQPRRRALMATVAGVDPRGVPRRLEATGLAARCLQHEVDHLAGRLFTDPVRDTPSVRVT